MICLKDRESNQSIGQSMDEITSIATMKRLNNRPIASLEGTRCAEDVQIVSELQELKEVQAEITHALSLMNEIREKLEVAYKELSGHE